MIVNEIRSPIRSAIRSPIGPSSGTTFALDATATAIRAAILDPASYASGGWLLPGTAGARLSASARASVAMQQRVDGGWEFAPHNLLLNSETAAASVSGGASNDGIVAVAPPSGVPAAAQVRQFTLTGASAIRFGAITGGTSGARLSAGLWVRTASGSTVLGFDCNDGTAVNPTVTSTWQYLSADNTANLATVYQFADLIQASGSSVIYVCAPRICLGLDPSTYIPTTTTAVYGPAIDWLSGIGAYGLRSEEARTNSIRNSACVGAVAGSPGTLPTNWSLNNQGALVSTVATGTENGLPYIDLRINGTSSTTQAVLFMDAATAIAAAPGQAWTSSAFVRLAGGALTNINTVGVGYTENNSGGNYVTDANAAFTPTTTYQRPAHTRTTIATTAFVQPYVILTFASGVAIDITLRIACPQLEQGAFATSPILTYGAAATRAADAVQITSLPSGIDSEGAVVMDFFRTLTAPSGIFPGIFDLGASTNERHIGYVSQGTIANAGGERRVGGVPQGAASGTGASGLNKFAYAWTQTNAAVAQNGAAASQVAATTLPAGPITRLNLGFADADRLNGSITRIRYATRRFTNAQLQAVSA